MDLKVNGSSRLTATITLSTTQSTYELVAGTISNESVSAGDVIEIDIGVFHDIGTLGKGVFAYVDLFEDND